MFAGPLAAPVIAAIEKLVKNIQKVKKAKLKKTTTVSTPVANV
jgi:hypothetical protein